MEDAVRKAHGYIDSDYELLCDMGKKDFHDHLVGMGFDLTKEQSFEMHKSFFGESFEEFKEKEANVRAIDECPKCCQMDCEEREWRWVVDGETGREEEIPTYWCDNCKIKF